MLLSLPVRSNLARAYVPQGDIVKAKTAYSDFLTVWKDADPDIPILIAAKAEYGKLHYLQDFLDERVRESRRTVNS